MCFKANYTVDAQKFPVVCEEIIINLTSSTTNFAINGVLIAVYNSKLHRYMHADHDTAS